MRLFFLQYGSRADDIKLALRMLASVRETMPGVVPIHMGDENTIPLCDQFQMIPRGDMLFAEYRALQEAKAQYNEGIFCDVDVIFREDIRPVFEQPFDVALTLRGENDPLAGEQKYVGGLILTRSPQFFHEVHERVCMQPGPLREWYGIQLAIDAVAASGRFKVLDLDDREYNRAPRDPADIVGAKVLHYRGPRKKWILSDVYGSPILA